MFSEEKMSFAFSVLFAMVPSVMFIVAATVALLHDHPCFAVFFAVLGFFLYPNVRQDPGNKAEDEADRLARIQKEAQEGKAS